LNNSLKTKIAIVEVKITDTDKLNDLLILIQNAYNLVHDKSVIKGNQDVQATFSTPASIDLPDGILPITYGYPLAQKTTW
jgi:hypothetical protein